MDGHGRWLWKRDADRDRGSGTTQGAASVARIVRSSRERALDTPAPAHESTMAPCSMAFDDAAIPLDPLPKRMPLSRSDQAASQHLRYARFNTTLPYADMRSSIQISASHKSASHVDALTYLEIVRGKTLFFLPEMTAALYAQPRCAARPGNACATPKNGWRARVRYFQRISAHGSGIPHRKYPDTRKKPRLSPGLPSFRNIIPEYQNVMLQLSMRPVSALELSLTRSRQLPLIVSEDRFTL
jgi:hypothetical protein